jgi:2'-5' RNA ligase
MIRAFLAVEGSDDLRAELGRLQQHLRRRLDAEGSWHIRLTWVRPEAIHLTVKFLGDVKDEIVDPLGAALGQALQNHRSITLPLARLGVILAGATAGAVAGLKRGARRGRALAALHQARWLRGARHRRTINRESASHAGEGPDGERQVAASSRWQPSGLDCRRRWSSTRSS